MKPGSLLSQIYGGAKSVKERHRHRYEANPKYRAEFEANGLIVSGESDGLIEAIELSSPAVFGAKDDENGAKNAHPWFVGVQFHPEFTSRLTSPNPVVLGFIKASLENCKS